MEQFAIDADFKSAAARWDERERFDAFAEFKNFGRQTDGLGRVVSDDAILDRDFGFHLELLSDENGTEGETSGQDVHVLWRQPSPAAQTKCRRDACQPQVCF